MKKLNTIIILLISLISYGQVPINLDSIRAKQLKIQNDSIYLDFDRMQEDFELNNERSPNTMKFGAYPYPHYDSIYPNSFSGLILSGSPSRGIKLKNKTIHFVNFLERKNKLNKNKFVNNDANERLFFTIITVSDTIDTVNYTTSNSAISSRNHPDYVAQGIFRMKDGTINYVAFTTMEGESYAIVNMKLFNLKFGQIILIAPQKDGTVRAKQLRSKEHNSKSIIEYLKSLFKEEEILNFLTNKNVI